MNGMLLARTNFLYRLFTVFILGLFIIPVFPNMSENLPIGWNGDPRMSDCIYPPETKILIDGDAALVAYPDKTGEGTGEDPYIISFKDIKCGGPGSGVEIRNTTKYLQLKYLRLTTPYSTISSNYEAGVMLRLCSNVVVQNCYIINNLWGILLQDCIDCIIEDNNIWENNIGIYVQENILASNIIIRGNELRDQGDLGIFLERCRNIILSDNYFINHSWYTIELEQTQNISINSNEINSKPTAIGIQLYCCNNTKIFSNLIQGSRSNYGIYILNSTDSVIETNLFNNNSIGIGVVRSGRNELIENVIREGNFGVYLYESNDNVLYKNRFFRLEANIEEIDCTGNQITIYIDWSLVISSGSNGVLLALVITSSIYLIKKRKIKR